MKTNIITKNINWVKTINLLIVTLMLSQCSQGGGGDGGTKQGVKTFAPYQRTVKMLVSKSTAANPSDPNDPDNIYDSTAGGVLSMVSGVAYNVTMSMIDQQVVVAANTPLVVKATNTSLPDQPTMAFNLKLGTTLITAPANGNYDLVLDSATMNAEFAAEVSCANPTFEASSLNANAITVTAVDDNNLFTFSAPGIVNTSAPNHGNPAYRCAWDVQGIGVKSTRYYTPCETPTGNLYVNYVGGPRKIGVIVQDSCFKSVSITKDITLSFTPPVPDKEPFILGNLGRDTPKDPSADAIAPDPRTNLVKYLALNRQPGIANVTGWYGKGTFVVDAKNDYGIFSTNSIGMNINIMGIVENAAFSGTPPIADGVSYEVPNSLDLTNASIKNIKYSTDGSGDKLPALVMNASTCEWTNRNYKVIQKGVPCKNGIAGEISLTKSIRIWGSYSCPSLENETKTLPVTGSFLGEYNIVDGCTGGGQGQGGGIAPPQF